MDTPVNEHIIILYIKINNALLHISPQGINHNTRIFNVESNKRSETRQWCISTTYMLQSNIRLYNKEPYSWYYKRRARANKLPFWFFFKSTNVFKNKIIKELQKYIDEIWLYFILQVYLRVYMLFFIIFVHWNIEKLFIFEYRCFMHMFYVRFIWSITPQKHF